MTGFLIKSTVSMAVLLAVYYIFIEREKMHLFKRFYLLFSLAFSFALPFITITFYKEVISETVAETLMVDIPVITGQQINHSPIKPDEANYWAYILWGVYGTITTLLFARFISNIARFYRLKSQNESVKYGNATVVLLDSHVLPHTFMNFIYVSKHDYEQGLVEPELFTHEMVHVSQHHTWDVLFIETLKTLMWFNPLLYLYKKAIQLNHEFLADQATLNQHLNIPTYQQLLLDKAVHTGTYTLASSINFGITKKRFTMMTRTTNTTKSILLKLAMLPVTAGLIYIISTETVARNPENNIFTNGLLTETDSVTLDIRRDEYFKDVRIIIEDKSKGVYIDKPYEKLSLEHKRYYLSSIPEKKENNGVSSEDYDFYIKYTDGIFYIDDKKVSLDEVLKYKREDFAHSGFKFSFENSPDGKKTEVKQIFFYSENHFNTHIKHINDHYPDKVYKVSILESALSYKETLKQDNDIINKDDGKSDLERIREKLKKDIDAPVYSYTEQMKSNTKNISPVFPGGKEEFYKYLSHKLDFGDRYSNKQISIHFTINTDGTLTDIRVYDETDNDIISKITKVVSESPKWIPAQYDGSPVKIGTTIKYPN